MSDKKRTYNETLIAMWATRSGNVMSMTIDARSFDQITSAVDKLEIGGKLILKKLTEDARSKFKNPDTAPGYFLEYISKESAAEYELNNPRNRSQGGL